MSTIQRLYVRHVKGVREIEIAAKPTVNEVAGPNGAGKSSVLDSILFALAGQRAVEARALREGEAEGSIKLETDELVIERSFKEGKTSSLRIKHKDGAKVGQRELDGMWGQFTFDPLAFSRMKPGEQIDVLRALAGPEWIAKLERADHELATAEEERTLLGRELKRFGQLPPVELVEPVEIKTITDELREIEAHNKRCREQNATLERANAELRAISARHDEAVRALEVLQKELGEAAARAADLPRPEAERSTHELEHKLAAAGEQNRRAEEYRAYKARLADQRAAVERHEAAEAAVDKLRTAREKLAASVPLPVEGLSFSTAGLRVGALPFEQLSSSEKIRLSARVGMATSAPLKIMLVRDGSLLDDDSYTELVNVAKDRGYQLWMETVGDGHGDAIHIEAGGLRDKF